MLVQFSNLDPVDRFPEAHRLTPVRAAALARMVAVPERRARIPLHLLPAAATLNALAKEGMEPALVALRTGISVGAATGFLDSFHIHSAKDEDRLWRRPC